MPPFPSILSCYLWELSSIFGLKIRKNALHESSYSLNGWSLLLSEDSAATATSISLILLSALLTGIGIYDRMAKVAGAGTIVPITGFANSVVSPAMEFKTEGFVMGVSAKIFTIAGPVLVYGLGASVIYGLIYWISTLL